MKKQDLIGSTHYDQVQKKIEHIDRELYQKLNLKRNILDLAELYTFAY